MPYKKNRIDVKVPHNSGFDMSHRNSGTLTCGTLTPILVEEVIPGTRCHLKIPEVVQLPPLVSDTYMNVKLKHEAFFVPMRLLSPGYESWFSNFPEKQGSYGSGHVPTLVDMNRALPVFRLDSTMTPSLYGAGSLLDYLGFKASTITSGGTTGYIDISPMSMLAYHLIWQEFYRNSRIQVPAFVRPAGTISSTSPVRIPSIIYENVIYGSNNTTWTDNHILTVSSTTESRFVCADNVSIFSLRQRNFGLDYFTGARVDAQQGNAMTVDIALPSGATSTSFTISQLRAANSLQMWRERSNLPSSRYIDQVMARYGQKLSDGVVQRPICIGSSTFDIVSRGVDQTAMSAATAGANPFHSVASQYGKAIAVGDGTLIDDFTANEHGFIMVLQSIVPEVTYSSGISPYLLRYLSEGSVVEIANNLLQNVGDEPIDKRWLSDAVISTSGTPFGYQDRFGTFMFHCNEVHSELRDGQTLSPFVLQRSFASPPTYSTSFLEIPTNYLDPVMVANTAISGFSAWYDAKLEWKISAPLAEFSIPSLQDPAYEHGRTVSIKRNGQIF